MAYGDLNEGVGYAILIVVLLFFFLIALTAAGYIPLCGCSPKSRFGKFVISSAAAVPEKSAAGEVAEGGAVTTVASEVAGADFYLSARNSAGPWTIAMSYFASGMGAWVVYGSTELGATKGVGWLGVIGYSAASGFPALIVAAIGPRVRRISGEKAFSTADFCYTRYGRTMQFITSGISIFYMWIYLVSELTSIGNIYTLVASNGGVSYAVIVAVIIVVVTVTYTSIAGLPASIVTDKFQAIMMGCLVVLITIALTAYKENHVTKEEYAYASQWTAEGFYALVTLFVAIACAEMFNQGTWQRVWAAESVSSMRKGFAMGSVMVFFLMFFFGLMAVIAYANDAAAYDSFEKLAYLSFFDLLKPLPVVWHVFVLVLVTSLAASSIDTLQNALASVFSKDIVTSGAVRENNMGKWIARLIIVVLNIPAIVVAAKQFSVLSLFLVADLVCATAVLPVFLGLITEPFLFGMIPPPTEVGAVLGTVCGFATVLVYGAVRQALGIWDGKVYNWMGEVVAEGTWSYFWLPTGGICALCGTAAMWTFIATVLSGGFFTLLFSFLHVAVVGEEKARRPIMWSCFGDGGGGFMRDESKKIDPPEDLGKEIEA
eukprot:CAMPEP_0194281548 /NCGR_PEP_ID=MMETSP0169-20130528/20933_1 /TAXON_ID=218684 /ORGANISM="Corethron pennatum, Strain L29A3" /LENGTH=600 /DNA_ID=CAMNT_0039026629 /DNA_START=117 /DNA_END=1919 /DNA_ORIENTATION=-